MFGVNFRELLMAEDDTSLALRKKSCLKQTSKCYLQISHDPDWPLAHLIQCISAAVKQISRDPGMVFTLLLVPLRETICFHLRRARYCCTQHFFFSSFFFLNSVQSKDYHTERSPQTQKYSFFFQAETLLSGEP